jgi:D-alanine--poly(phosphoribitol) ligase subunit 1
VDQCLADESFTAELIPNLQRMMLAGEVLRHETVREVQRRFPGVHVFNGYGPTEAGFVTLCDITPAMLDADRSLPIGYAKPDIDLVVLNPETLERVPNGQPGELFLIGPTVGKGYWKLPEQTEAGFRSCPKQYWAEPGVRAYRTGDECILEDDGLAYYHGRLDLQVKLHGFRIELGDIESALFALPEVHMACVLPVWKDGAISHLAAMVMLADEDGPRGFALTKQLKASLRTTLPGYMIPRVFKYVDSMPLNQNGKADRKALARILEG